MMAGPTAPGRGLRVYQPATDVVEGTWTVPCAVRPSEISRVRTPISGMVSAAGIVTGGGSVGCGDATIGAVAPGRCPRPRTGPVRVAGQSEAAAYGEDGPSGDDPQPRQRRAGPMRGGAAESRLGAARGQLAAAIRVLEVGNLQALGPV